jgi:hypothetical protein
LPLSAGTGRGGDVASQNRAQNIIARRNFQRAEVMGQAN